MKVNYCLVCLKACNRRPGTDKERQESNPSSSSAGIPLLTRFLNFAQNYLDIDTAPFQKLLFSTTGDDNVEERGAFCSSCKLSVITPICEAYLQFLSAQLRLSWELGELGKVLDKSHHSMSHKLKVRNMNKLGNQLGINSVGELKEFRSVLQEKCKFSLKIDY